MLENMLKNTLLQDSPIQFFNYMAFLISSEYEYSTVVLRLLLLAMFKIK